MILGLCGSFAVVPVVSVMKGGAGAPRRLVEPARSPSDGPDPSSAPGDEAVAALLLSGVALSSALPDGSGVRSSVSLPSLASAATEAAAAVGPNAKPEVAGPSVPGAPAVPGVPAVPGLTASPPTTPVPKSVPAPAVAAAPPPRAAPPVSHAAGAASPHPATRSTQGVASWLDIAAGTCANNDAPMGAIITVTNAAGVSVTCKVVSRGPFVVGRVVDLARSTFAKLGSVSQGLVGVSVTW